MSLEKTSSDIYKSLDSKKYFDNEYFIDLSETSVELNNVFNDNKYDIIFHFGAQALVSIASKNPLDTLKTNIFWYI